MIADAGSSTPNVYWVHTDQLDRPIMMTDSQPDGPHVVWQASYLPFGEVHSINGPAALDYRFPGHWFQLETGLHYNWHRHYDPTTGRYGLAIMGLIRVAGLLTVVGLAGYVARMLRRERRLAA